MKKIWKNLLPVLFAITIALPLHSASTYSTSTNPDDPPSGRVGSITSIAIGHIVAWSVVFL